jgi:hypothetical protein
MDTSSSEGLLPLSFRISYLSNTFREILMSDLPTFGLTQQMNARPVTGEHLEVLGKQASARFMSGESKDLSTAVIETVKHAHLSPEQVQRVVEFANTDAYLKEFKKEGQEHKYIDFGHGKLANASEILKELNAGGGGSVFDAGMGDYHAPPSKAKTASAQGEDGVKTAGAKSSQAANDFDEKLAELFLVGSSEPEYPYAEPLAPVVELHEKLAACERHISDQISGCEIMYADLADSFYNRVKQAALGGAELGEIVQALGGVAPSTEHMKVAFQLITPRLLREGVFSSTDAVESSLQKVAGDKMVNHEHPMLVDFEEFCEVLSKLAHLRKGQTEAAEAVGGVMRIIKEAGAHPGGLYGMVGDALKNKVAPVAGKVVGKAFGEGGIGQHITEGAVGNAHHIGAAVLANQILGGKPAAVLNSYMPWDSQDKMIRQQAGIGSLITGRY